MMPHSAIQKPDLPTHMHPTARVWVYQSSRVFTNEELAWLHTACDTFVKNWKAHSTELLTDYRILYNRFICLFVDESRHGASGCSIDGSVRFILSAEQKLGISLTNRMEVATLSGNEVTTFNLHDISKLIKEGSITSETMVFDNLVANLQDMQGRWILPISESWHRQMIR